MNYRGIGRGSCLGKKGPPSCEPSSAIMDWVPGPRPCPGRPWDGDWCVEEFLGNTGHEKERGKGKEAGLVRGTWAVKQSQERSWLTSWEVLKLFHTAKDITCVSVCWPITGFTLLPGGVVWGKELSSAKFWSWPWRAVSFHAPRSFRYFRPLRRSVGHSIAFSSPEPLVLEVGPPGRAVDGEDVFFPGDSARRIWRPSYVGEWPLSPFYLEIRWCKTAFLYIPAWLHIVLPDLLIFQV